VGLDKLRSTIVVCDASEEEEESIEITLNARVSKPATAAITMTTVATATTSEGGRRKLDEEGYFFLVAADVIIFIDISNVMYYPVLT
jgi:hypothetical protein